MCTASEISKRTYYKYRNPEDKDYYDYQKNKIKDSTLKTYKNRIKYMGLLDNVELVNLNWDLYQKWRSQMNKTNLFDRYKTDIQKLLSKSSTLLKNNGILI